MNDWIFGGIVFSLLSVFMSWTAINSTRDNVNRFRSPGIRTVRTLSSQEAWQQAHRRARPYFWWTGAVLSLVAIAFLAWGVFGAASGSADLAIGVVMAALILWVAMIGVIGHRAAANALTPATSDKK